MHFGKNKLEKFYPASCQPLYATKYIDERPIRINNNWAINSNNKNCKAQH